MIFPYDAGFEVFTAMMIQVGCSVLWIHTATTQKTATWVSLRYSQSPCADTEVYDVRSHDEL